MKNFTKASLIALTVLSASVTMSPAFAADEFNVAPGMTYAGAPLGLHGADPVALLNGGTQIEGDPQFFAAHEGVAYYFENAENKATFEADPKRFLPQNGGFCTYGVFYSKKFDGNPDFAAVVEGKLYVFVNQAALDTFNEDRTGMITQSDANWLKIKNIKASEL